jgi:hypothetical protein
VYQPADLMDFCVGLNYWNKLSPKMQQWVEDEIEVYSRIHNAAIQTADMGAWDNGKSSASRLAAIRAPPRPDISGNAV